MLLNYQFSQSSGDGSVLLPPPDDHQSSLLSDDVELLLPLDDVELLPPPADNVGSGSGKLKNGVGVGLCAGRFVGLVVGAGGVAPGVAVGVAVARTGACGVFAVADFGVAVAFGAAVDCAAAETSPTLDWFIISTIVPAPAAAVS